MPSNHLAPSQTILEALDGEFVLTRIIHKLLPRSLVL
jgi:hypothetical protein